MLFVIKIFSLQCKIPRGEGVRKHYNSVSMCEFKARGWEGVVVSPHFVPYCGLQYVVPKRGRGREGEGGRKNKERKKPLRLLSVYPLAPALLPRQVMAKGSFLLSKLDQRLFTTF